MLQYKLLCSIIQLSLLYAQSEIPAQAVTLLDRKSYVEYKFIEWNYEVDGSQLTVPIRFRTRSINGRLMTLSAYGTKESIFTLSATINNTAMVVDLIVGQRKMITETTKHLSAVNNGMEYSLSIQLNLERKMLKMIYGMGVVDWHEFTDSIEIENRTLLAMTVGSSGTVSSQQLHLKLLEVRVVEGVDGVIGCVAILGLTVGDRFVFELEERRRSENGTCVDLFHTAVCNCRGTYRSGKRCDRAMRTLNVSWDQYISYRISDDESQPNIISIEFKTDVKEGLIIHGTISSLETGKPIGELKVALIYGQLQLTVANRAEISFDNITLDSDRFNQILLEFEYSTSTIRITLNGNAKSVNLNTSDKDYHFRFDNELFFCAGDIEVGLSGCLRGIYVDYFDVIEGYARGSTKVDANAKLRSCSRSGIIDVVAEGAKILPLSSDEEVLVNGIAEEQEYDVGVDYSREHVTSEIEQHHDEQRKGEENFKLIKNSVKCTKEDGMLACSCREGFVGPLCQFSLFPWNCDEIYRNGNTISGTYVIDPDGPGPLPETYAYCERGKTVVPHNMPNNTVIHNKDLGDIHMIVNYKLFNDELLRSLKRNSVSCSQTVLYSCSAAPLRFDKMKTWFTSIANEFFRGFGIDGTCACQSNKCKKCNCDDGGVASDYGILTGDQVPVRGIYRLTDTSVDDDKGDMTLGPLVCVGSAGQSDAYTMTIREQFASTGIGTWSGSTLSFEFRTYLQSATLLASNDARITIAMNERTFRLEIKNQINLTLISQSRKNDGHWHRIIVHIRDGSVRFSVDDTVATTAIKRHSFSNAYLSIGGGRNGFLGCIRQILLNGTLQEVRHTLRSKCINKCESHHCPEESRCEEDFASDTVRCVCKNTIVHSGHLCQNNIVQPPVSPITDDSATFNRPYVLLFVAGVPTEVHFGKLEPIYRSTTPNLLGCMRSLIIGKTLIDMRDRHYWSNYPAKSNSINFGCKMGCSKIENLCKNDGRCLVRWSATRRTENNVSCNCARTSYYGKYCDEEDGAHFTGSSILILNAVEIFEKVIFDWQKIDDEIFSFAFSTTKSTKFTRPQALATIHFKHNKTLQVTLCKNGSMNIDITSSNATLVHTFPHNYNDGYRHYFHSTFRGGKSLQVAIDSSKYDILSDLAAALSLTYAIKFSFGGPFVTNSLDTIGDDKKAVKDNYTGCLSNVEIDINVARINLRPILYLRKSEFEFAESVKIIAIPNTVEAPHWDSPFIIEPYQRLDDDSVNVSETEIFEFQQTPAVKNDFDLPEPDQQLDTVPPNRNADDNAQSTKLRNAPSTAEAVLVTVQQPARNSIVGDDSDCDCDDDMLMNCRVDDDLPANQQNLSAKASPQSSAFKASSSPPKSLHCKPSSAKKGTLISVPSHQSY
ncbi:unnamed protein product [Litomosoides sigmodontis]|uniref:Laminin G domain-containing protein n=1 Tax=Litomosoides sigmodontis TaxID=42156 RepID=A0A3P6TWR0_LITSI|nr:unnamed protein product [Litomosoides sigmodontis]